VKYRGQAASAKKREEEAHIENMKKINVFGIAVGKEEITLHRRARSTCCGARAQRREGEKRGKREEGT